MSYAATWTGLVTAISDEVVARLSAAGMPPLNPMPDGSDGRILIGRENVSANWAPPKIVMVPTGFRMGPRSTASPMMSAPDRRAEMADGSIVTQWKQFEVHVWNCNFVDQATPAPNPDLDWDAVDALYNVLWQACQNVAAGMWATKQGTIDRNANEWARLGRYAIFDLELSTPVLRDMVPLSFVPNGTIAKATTNLQPADGGAPEVGCSN